MNLESSKVKKKKKEKPKKIRGAWGEEGESLADIAKHKRINLIPVPQKKKNVFERNADPNTVDLEDEFEFPSMEVDTKNQL